MIDLGGIGWLLGWRMTGVQKVVGVVMRCALSQASLFDPLFRFAESRARPPQARISSSSFLFPVEFSLRSSHFAEFRFALLD